MRRKAKIAVVGTGWWATANHIPGLLEHPDAELVALCDLDKTKARQAAAAFGVKTIYTNVDQLLQKETLDGVVVATYHATHYEVAQKCLLKGLHVYIEKPMTLFAPQAQELVALAEANGREIIMGYNHNHNPFSIRARELIQSGELGAVEYVTGQFSQPVKRLLAGAPKGFTAAVHTPGDVYSDPVRSGGGHGHLQITHLAGLLFFTTGLRVKRVHALMNRHGLAVDVVNAMTVEFDNGALGNIGGTANVGGGGRRFKLAVFCEHGWLDINDTAGTLHTRREGQDMEIIRPEHEHKHPYFAPIHNFVEVIIGQAENICSGVVGWRAVELMDAAYRSAADNGRAVRLEEVYQETTT